MKPFKNYILPLLLLLVFINSNAQFIFQKALGTNGDDTTRELLITSDGNYLVMGFSWGGDSLGLYLTKIDTSGTILWEKWHYTIGGMGTGVISTICETSDLGFVLGNKFYNGSGYDGMLIKLDSNGDTLFTKHDSVTLGNNVGRVLQAPDGNLLALVDKNGLASLVKMDNNFNLIGSIDGITPLYKDIEVINNKIYYYKQDSLNNLLIIDNDLLLIDTITIPIKYPLYMRKSLDETQLIFYGEETLGPLPTRKLKMVYTNLVGNISSVCDSVYNVGGIFDFRAINTANSLIYASFYYDATWGIDVRLYFTDECGVLLHDTILYRASWTIQPLDEWADKVLVDNQGNYIIYGRGMYGPLGGQSDIFFFKYKKWQDTTTSIDENTISEVNRANVVMVFPNPFNDGFTISGITENSNITVLDVMGKVIHSNTTHNTQHTIPTTNWAKGLYIVQLRGNQSSTTLKVIKQ